MKYPSDINSEVPNCGVTAVAVISEKSVAEVHQYMAKKYKKASHWKGRTAVYQVIETLNDFGFRLRFHFERKGSRRGPQIRKQCFALNTVYLAITSSHMFVVYNDAFYDQSGVYELKDFPSKNCFLTHVIEVL